MSYTMKARPTIYNGIQMRSRTEAYFAALLDGKGGAWLYEPQVFANRNRQYLPDFHARIETSPLDSAPQDFEAYFEVKPTLEMARSVFDEMHSFSDQMRRFLAVFPLRLDGQPEWSLWGYLACMNGLHPHEDSELGYCILAVA